MKIITSTLLICIAISVLALLIILSQTVAKMPSPGANVGFVTRSGTRLMLNGQPFRFAGANIHWLALDDSTNYPSQFRVNDALDAAEEMGLTVIRSHNLGISTGCPNCIEPSLGVFNEKALEHVDYVIKAAGDRGLRLIIPLTDNYHYPAGGKHTFTDWRGISDENQFYSNPQVIGDFETYISTLLNRVNSYTGIPYKDDPTILAWETGNELQPPTSWTQTISTYIKRIDKNHLIIDGRRGIDPNAARLTNVDILSDHYYPKSIASMNADAAAATKAGKAFIVGEFDWNDANGGDTLSSFLASVQANPAVAGDAFWELWSHGDQYGYVSNGKQYTLHYPGDTPAMRSSVQLLRSYAYKMSNQPIPPDSVPGTPLLETVIRNGTNDTLVWRGTALAANYTIERSQSGPNGPWSVICDRCATDNDTPWVDASVPAGLLWYRVRAYNLSGMAGPPSDSYQAGSTSSSSQTPTSTPPAGIGVTTIDDSSIGTGVNHWNYTGGGWHHCTNCNETNPPVTYSDASQSWDSVVNDTASITFNGTQIKLYGVTGPWHGIAGVAIDGGTEAMVDLYSAKKTGDVLVWTSPQLSSGVHTLRVRVTGAKNAKSTGIVIPLDRVDIINAT